VLAVTRIGGSFLKQIRYRNCCHSDQLLLNIQGGHSSNPAVSAGDDPGASNRFQMRVNSVGAAAGRGLQSGTPTSRLPIDHASGEMLAANNAVLPDYTGRAHGHTPPMDPLASGRLVAEYAPHCKHATV
jgi:hypothetical protein